MDAYVGEIRILPYGFAPNNWFECDGQILPIAQYTALFSLIGTSFGGNGSSNFALPSLQGFAAVGAGQGNGLSNYDLGESTGQSSVALQTNEMPSHNHGLIAKEGNISGPGESIYTGNPANGELTFAFTRPSQSVDYEIVPGFSSSSNTTLSLQALATTGSSQPHNNQQPVQSFRFCICWAGIFPPRS